MRKCKRLLLLLCAAALLAGLTAVLAAAETDGWQLTLGPTNPDLTEETDNDQYSNEAPLYIYNADFNGDASEVGYLHTSDAFLRYKYFITFAPVVGSRLLQGRAGGQQPRRGLGGKQRGDPGGRLRSRVLLSGEPR